MKGKNEKTATGKTEIAIFAAGCFWGVEEIFRTFKGVKATRVGYIGGRTQNPTYEEVCNDETGHAEAVEVTYNPNETSYEKLVHIFFKNHNPTTLNQQGPDVGEQYRSAIFYTSDAQKRIAEKVKKEVDKKKAYAKPIVTQILPAQEFYEAEEYHQKYFHKRGITKTCHT